MKISKISNFDFFLILNLEIIKQLRMKLTITPLIFLTIFLSVTNATKHKEIVKSLHICLDKFEKFLDNRDSCKPDFKREPTIKKSFGYNMVLDYYENILLKCIESLNDISCPK